MSPFLIAFFVFQAAASLIIVIALLITAVQSSPEARIQKRLAAIDRYPHLGETEVKSLLKDSVLSEVPWLNDLLTRLTFVRDVNTTLERANLDITVGLFFLFSFFCGAVIFFLLMLFGKPAALAFLVGLIGCSGPYVYVKYLTRKRLRRFLEQMPDGLGVISQGLQAGLGMTQSLVYLTKEMPDPIGTEFSVFMEELNLGLPLGDALNRLENRVPLQEIRLFNIALTVQREIGGSLGELLDRLADVIRDRFRIERQIKTLTAQARMSVWIVSSIPPLLAVFMFAMDPVMMSDTWSHPVGRIMYIAASVSEVIGIFAFRALIRIHI